MYSASRDDRRQGILQVQEGDESLFRGAAGIALRWRYGLARCKGFDRIQPGFHHVERKADAWRSAARAA